MSTSGDEHTAQSEVVAGSEGTPAPEDAEARLRRAHAGPDHGARAIDDRAPGFPVPSLPHPEVALALSGGGLRATLFHLGALWRLRELGYLQAIDAFSGVSGGAIMAAILATAWPRLEADDFSAETFRASVVEPTLRFSGLRIDAVVIGLGLLPLVKPADLLARVLRHRLLGDIGLHELPDRPRFIFNAAHVATGMSWVMQKAWMGDARLGIVADPHIRLADAVAASASFPPVVAPFWLDLPKDELLEIPGADLFAAAAESGLAERVLLLDGGAYDNLGAEPIGRARIVLASSAGGDLKVDTRRFPYRLPWPLLLRTLEMAIEVGRVQRRQALIDRANASSQLPAGADFREEYRTRHVALWRTSNDLSRSGTDWPEAWVALPAGWVVAPGWSEYLASLKTRLWPMPMVDRHRLINWGYLTSDIMLRSYVPELGGAPEPAKLPFPESDFSAAPPARR